MRGTLLCPIQVAFQVQHILLDFPSKEPGLFIGLVKQWGNYFFGYILADFLSTKRTFLNAPEPGMTPGWSKETLTKLFPIAWYCVLIISPHARKIFLPIMAPLQKKTEFWPKNHPFCSHPEPGMTLQGGLNGPTSCFLMDWGVIWPMRQILCIFHTLL